ncbi:PAS domain S-box protein [Pseudomonas anguilliseptica]|nr:PAS domain S-box protein [Pseudomonas anguilliseptica]
MKLTGRMVILSLQLLGTLLVLVWAIFQQEQWWQWWQWLLLVVVGSLFGQLYLMVRRVTRVRAPLTTAPLLDVIKPDIAAGRAEIKHLAENLARSQKEKNLARERMQAIFETLQEGIVTLDCAGLILSANPAALRLFEADGAHFIGSRLWDWLQLDEVQQALLSNTQPLAFSLEQLVDGVRSSGERFPLSLHIDSIDLEGAEHYVATLSDVSDLLGVRDKLALSQAVKSSILASALDAIITVDDQGLIIEFNPAAEQTFGHTRSTVLGKEMADLIIPEALRAAHRRGMQHYLSTGEHKVLGQRVEVTGLHRDGHEFPIELAIAPIRLDQRTLFTAYVRDITDRRVAEAELQQAKSSAEAASRAKGDFLAVMSHELRTPLNAIIGSISLLSESSLALEQRKLLINAAQAGKAMLWLVNDILDFSKIEVGMLELEHYPFELAAVVEEVLFLLAPRAKDKSIDLSVVLDPKLPHKVKGDAGRIRQILINLVGNAIKFTEHGGVSIRLSVDEQAGIRVEVEDSGIGITQTVQEKLFSEFIQGDSAYSRKYGGTGLGLAICKRLTEMMNGCIGLKSRLGEGSCFWFTLPLEVETPAMALVNPELLPRRVLLQESNRMTAAALLMQMQHWQIEVERSVVPEQDHWLRWMDSDGSEHCLSLGINQQGQTAHIPTPVLPRLLAQALAGLSLDGQERIQSGAEQQPRPEQFGRILLAEDSLANQMVAEAMLQRAGYEVDSVANGAEAVQAVEAGKYDLVLMDLSMPEMDGITATQLLRQRGYDLPILAMTANVLKEDLDRCMQAGMNGYVTKPVVHHDLLNALRTWLADKSVHRVPKAPVLQRTEEAVETLWNEAILLQLQRDIGAAMPRMISLYIQEASKRSDAITAAISAQDMTVMCHESHALKSSSGTLGAVAIQNLALRLEMACIDSKLHEALALAQQLAPLLAATLEHLPAVARTS